MSINADLPVIELPEQLEDTQVEQTPVVEETTTDDTVVEDTTDADDVTNDTPAEETSDLATVLYEELTNLGYLDEDASFDGTHEWIQNKLESLPEKALFSAIEQLPPITQKVIEFAATAKQDLTAQELYEFVQTVVGEQVSPDFDTLDVARQFLEGHLSKQGLSKRAIAAELDQLEEDNELSIKAKEIYNSSPKKTDQLISDKKEATAAQIEQQKAFTKAFNQELDAFGWKPSKKQEVLTIVPKVNDLLNKIGSSPKAYAQFLDILTQFNGTEFNLEAYRKQGESRAAQRLQQAITKSGASSAASSKATKDESSNSILEQYEILAPK